MEFRNRQSDLRLLDDRASGRKARFIVVYGRRRIGKTVLLQHWLREHLEGEHLHWTAHRTTSDVLLEGFSAAVQRLTPEVQTAVRFATWEAAFVQLFRLAASRRLVVVIDEFPYLVESVPEIPTLLQKLWDREKESTRLFLILCGSHYHMMHEQFASRQQPLFGRASESLVVDEISPEDLALFLPRYSPEQIVETYGVIGGVPGYLELWDDGRPVLRNVADRLFSGSTFFSQEALLLIHDEISDPRTYLAILEGLGANLRTPADLARTTGIAINHMGKYLRTLLDLRFIRRVLSEDAKDRSRSRMSRYEIRDPFLRFYFHYIYPHTDLVQQKRVDRLNEIVQDSFESYIGSTAYEELARRLITRLGDAGEVPFSPDYIGRAWTRDVEIDVVAVSWKQRAVLLGECKWRRTPLSGTALDDLISRSEKFDKFAKFKKHYALFSKTGFTAPMIARAAEEKVFLFKGGELNAV